MATMEKFVPAGVEHVWAVLADPRGYAFWVVGSHDIRAADDDWPRPGATFHHTQGHGPIKLRDTSTVVESQPPSRLVLEVRVRPFVVAEVRLELAPVEGGTCVTIFEEVHGGLVGLVPGPLQAPFLFPRNAEALRRLAAMAWTRAQATADPG